MRISIHDCLIGVGNTEVLARGRAIYVVLCAGISSEVRRFVDKGTALTGNRIQSDDTGCG